MDFDVLVEKAKIAKEVKGSERQNRDRERGKNKRSFGSSGSSVGFQKRPKLDGLVRVGVPVTVGRLQPCVECGKFHLEECWRRTGRCFRCGSKDHRFRDCTREPVQTQVVGQRFVQRGRGGQYPSRGRGSLQGGNGIGRGRGAPSRGAGNVGNANTRQPGLVYAAQHREDGDAPDVITGMGWLVKHRAKLDRAAKHMVLKTPEDEEVMVIEERRDYLSNVISALKAKKMVRKGCEAFLAFVSTSDANEFSVGDVRTVKEFSDIFPEELPGLPPNREVEFGIKLLPGTAPLSIAPYRMAPKELVELKA
ncbi:hypothetical protein EPI10_024292 [Gossypium australe]|uniref:CCHC-type domain-containing protein n=1 Tax=Gossypium australe TaxID=47621 RepID=A0A5B6VYP4_9ROSI|nr:hypothetical protein EPI10_024292 [Gossypium australe]